MSTTNAGAGSLAVGRITEGPAVTLAEKTIHFVADEMVSWRDDPERTHEAAEERLNAQLCKFLNVAANDHFPMVLFSHEEKQTGARRVDFAANPSHGMIIGKTYHSIYNPFLVFEGKRLPAPSKDREREYVTGGEEKSGGIQRFKLGLHGARQEQAAILAYIQSGAPNAWLTQINTWVDDEARTPSASGERWIHEEKLTNFTEDLARRTSEASSVHVRDNSISDKMLIKHLWIVM